MVRGGSVKSKKHLTGRTGRNGEKKSSAICYSGAEERSSPVPNFFKIKKTMQEGSEEVQVDRGCSAAPRLRVR